MSKRGQNEGSIYRRTDGRWAGTVSLGYRNGKRWRKTYYGKTRKEVQEKLANAVSATQKGLPLVPERQKLGQYLEDWLKLSVELNVRPRTFESYSAHVRLHITPALGHLRLAKLTPLQVQGLIIDKLEEGFAPATVRYTHAVLRRALGQAERWGLVSRNVATLVDPPRAKKSEIQPLSPAEARKLLDVVAGNRLSALYTVALGLGLRMGEILALRWDDVDLDARTIRVRSSLQRIGGKLAFVEPKSERSRRTLAIPQTVAQALRIHRAGQLQERLIAGSNWKEHGLIFATTIGTPMDARNFTRHFKAALKRANLPPKRFHDLRHTCASFLVAQGVHPRVVMEVLGHSQISLTMDTYSHVLPEFRASAADEMEKLLGTKK